MSGSSLTPPGSPTSSRAGGSTAVSLSSSTGSFAGRSVTSSATPPPHIPLAGSDANLKDAAAKKLANRQITIPSADPSVDTQETNLHKLLGKALNHMGAVLKLPEALATPLLSDPAVIADFIASAKETLALAKKELNDAAQGFDAELKNDPDVKGMLEALEAFEATLNAPADPAKPTTIDFPKAKEKATLFVTHFNALLTKAESMEDKGPGLASRIGRFIFAGVVCVASIIPFTLAILFFIAGGSAASKEGLFWPMVIVDTTVKFVGVTIEMAKKKYEPQYADLRVSLESLSSALAEDLVVPPPSSSAASASSPTTPAGAPRSASTPPFAAATTTTSSAASPAVSTSTTPPAALPRSASAPSFPTPSPTLFTGSTPTVPAASVSHSSVSSSPLSTTAASPESSAMSSSTEATVSRYPKPPGGYPSLADAFGRLREIGEEEDERHRNASAGSSQPGLAARTPPPVLPPRTLPSAATASLVPTSLPTPEEQRRQSQAAIEALLSALFTSPPSNPIT